MYKAIEIQAPNHLKLKHGYTSIFLAGSIEMGQAEEWQRKIIDSVPTNQSYSLIQDVMIGIQHGGKQRKTLDLLNKLSGN